MLNLRKLLSCKGFVIIEGKSPIEICTSPYQVLDTVEVNDVVEGFDANGVFVTKVLITKELKRKLYNELF